MNQAIVIIPTYNEKENISRLIREILSQNLDLDILVVDDNSPDGTSQLVESLKVESQRVESQRVESLKVESLKVESPKVSLLKRSGKLGFASAYLDGFKWALDKGYNILLQMDADLSHQPKYLPEFLKSIKEYDLVIGSRYVEGGGLLGWPWYRRFLSRFASFYARTILGAPIKDLTGGFNCYRRQVLETVDLTQIVSQGYSFLLELKYKTYLAGFKIKEVPIVFIDRSQGKSKISKKIIWEAAVNCWKLRFSVKPIKNISSS